MQREHQLKDAMKVEVSKRSTKAADVIVLDGCAILWIVHWPENGNWIMLHHFNRYSPKSSTRQGRVASVNQRHTLSLSSSLPSQNTVLKSTHNKIQLIDIITKYLLEHTNSSHKVMITTSIEVPEETHNGNRQKREVLRTPHEEADSTGSIC